MPECRCALRCHYRHCCCCHPANNHKSLRPAHLFAVFSGSFYFLRHFYDCIYAYASARDEQTKCRRRTCECVCVQCRPFAQYIIQPNVMKPPTNKTCPTWVVDIFRHCVPAAAFRRTAEVREHREPDDTTVCARARVRISSHPHLACVQF